MIDFNEAVLKTFENESQEDERFFYPLKTQKEVRNFTKAIKKLGLDINWLCREINAAPHDFEIWESNQGSSWIGYKIMEKVNSYIGSVFIGVDTTISHKVRKAQDAVLKNVKNLSNLKNKSNKLNHNKSRIKVNNNNLLHEVTFSVVPCERLSETETSSKNTLANVTSKQKELFRNEIKTGSQIQHLIDKFNKLDESSRVESCGIGFPSHVGPQGDCLAKRNAIWIDGKTLSQDGAGANGSLMKVTADEMKSEGRDKVFPKETFSNRQHTINKAKSLDLTFKQKSSDREIPLVSNLKMISNNSERQIYTKRDPGGAESLTSKNKENVIATWDAMYSKVDYVSASTTKQKIETFNHFCAQKELKDSTNLKIKANTSRKFGFNVSQIISKFNKL